MKTIDAVPPLAWGKTGETTFCGALNAAAKAMKMPRVQRRRAA